MGILSIFWGILAIVRAGGEGALTGGFTSIILLKFDKELTREHDHNVQLAMRK